MSENESEQISKARLVIDDSHGEVPPDIMAMLSQVGAEMGMDVVSGPVVACDGCGYFECVCLIRKEHKETCRFRRAMECPVDVPCVHDLQACPECDKCDCKGTSTP